MKKLWLALRKWCIGYFKDVVHNVIVHPLMVLMPARLATLMHDKNANWAYGVQRFDEVQIEQQMSNTGKGESNAKL